MNSAVNALGGRPSAHLMAAVSLLHYANLGRSPKEHQVISRKLKILLLSLTGLLFVAQHVAIAAPRNDKGPIKLDGIKGQDDRVLVERIVLPWSAIGRVNRRTGGFCTGTVIGPRRVLTAAHCLWNRRTRHWLPPVSLHFVSGYTRGDFIVHARITKFRVSPDYNPNKSIRSNLSADWAVLELDKEVASKVGIIPLNRKYTGDAVSQAGYSQDKPHILTLNKACRIVGRQARLGLMFHDCDAVKGDSGSPVLARIGGRYQIIGIHVATRKRANRVLGIAVSIGDYFNVKIDTEPLRREPLSP